jgi:pyridoxine 5-phosphate synthase
MIGLSVNVNKIAWLRNARLGTEPDPLKFALQAIACGVHGITVHPRPDLRHITPRDVANIKKNISVELNIEGNPLSPAREKYPGCLPLVKEFLPQQCTLVPDSEHQITSDHGWDLKQKATYLQEVVCELQELRIRVSLFLDASFEDWDLLAEVKPDRVELFTGPFAQNFGKAKGNFYWHQLRIAAEKIAELNIELNAGHDLNLQNLQKVKNLKHLKEVSIGQALVAESLREGWQQRIKKYLACLQ